MRYILNKSVRTKLLLILMLIAFISLSLTGAILIYKDIRKSKSNLVDSLTHTGKVIGKRTLPILEFSETLPLLSLNNEKAISNLSDLALNKSVIAACIYDKDKRLFAEYFSTHHSRRSKQFCPEFNKIGSFFSKNSLEIFLPILNDKSEEKGQLYILSSLDKLKAEIYKSVINTTIIMVVIFFITYIIALRMQKIISQPIIKLEDATLKIKDGNYEYRVNKLYDDEIGRLTDSFNSMLGEIHKRDSELKNINKTLEQKVQERTQDLEFTIQRLEQANESQALWIQNIGHEIRTPIHGVISYAEFGMDEAEDEGTDRAELKHYFERIMMRGERLGELINSLLDFGKIQSGNMLFSMRENNLLEVIKTVVEEVDTKLAERELSVDIKEPEFSTDAYFDKNRIIQVLTNLLSNASKFSPEKGTITIDFFRDRVMTKAGTEHDAIGVSVSDSGVGIPENELEDIFDTFKQSTKTADGSGGTGLGLSISREIIHAHLGRIWAENNPSGGAAFNFVIPIENIVQEEQEATESGQEVIE